MRSVIFLLGSLAAGALAADSTPAVAIIPKPVTLTTGSGVFTLKPATVITTDRATARVGRILADSLAPATGFTLRVSEAPAAGGISLAIDPSLTRLGDEGYLLTVTSREVSIRAPKPAGVFYGTLSLRQLLPPAVYSKQAQAGVRWTVPAVKIEDSPRFVWRGAMLDVVRHFMPKDAVLRFIDLLAMQKMNTFHFHLTDDQGWRIQIRKYPKLTEIGAWRKQTRIGHEMESKEFDGKPHGGFYTQQDIRDIVAYAADRFITVVPEIEMPGHATAAIAAYPELGNTGKPIEVGTYWGVFPSIFSPRETTITFLQDVLTEVMELFPGKFIHIGGDEVPKDEWKASPELQALMKQLGLKDEEQMQSWFVGRMDKFLSANGRRLVGWDEILEGGLAQGATVMSWRGIEGGIAAAKAGHDVVMTPNDYIYLNQYQGDKQKEPLAIGGFLPLEKVYSYDPVPKDFASGEARHVLGTQGNIWTEYMDGPRHMEYMAFPRLAAIAEVAWTPLARKAGFEEFRSRIRVQEQRWKAFGSNFRPVDKN